MSYLRISLFYSSFIYYLLLDYCWFVTFENYLRKNRTNNYKNRRKLKVFCFYLTFFCYLYNDFPHSLLDDCRFKRLFENKTAHAVLREAKSSDGVDEAGSIGKAARRFRQRWKAENGIEPMNER